MLWTETSRPEYAIAGSYKDYLVWMRGHRERRGVTYLTRERAEALLAQGAQPGVLHRLSGWETSEARAAAEALEGEALAVTRPASRS